MWHPVEIMRAYLKAVLTILTGETARRLIRHLHTIADNVAITPLIGDILRSNYLPNRVERYDPSYNKR